MPLWAALRETKLGMRKMKVRFALTGFAAAAAMTAGIGSAAAMTDKLNAVTSLDQNNVLVVSFKTNYLKPANEKFKGKIEIKYLGGQEIVPPRKAVTALRRGQFNVLHSPTAYYIGTVPEGYAILAANQGPKALRANGAWEILQEVYLKKAGAHLLAWGENMTSYNTYLLKMPKFDKDGVPDLTGLKMRATGTYRRVLAVGGGAINTSLEVFTALQPARSTVSAHRHFDRPARRAHISGSGAAEILPANTVVTVHAMLNKLLRTRGTR